MADSGRPTIYSDYLADKICERLAAGESMRSISRDDGMPAMSTLFKWLRENSTFSQQYARAKEECADMYAEEIIEIADDGSNDWMENNNAEGESLGWRLNGEHVQRSRLRVDSRKWIASKLKPKKYGDKISQEHTSPDGSMTPKGIDASKLSTQALKELMAARDDSSTKSN